MKSASFGPLVFALGICSSASAHVAPAVDENNRYLDLTVIGDRAQLRYVVMVGDNPAQQLRSTPEWNVDAYVQQVAKDVLESITIVVNDARAELTWSDVGAELDIAEQYPNAFSISMLGWICLPPGSTYELSLHDDFELGPPGETVLTIKPGPGITITSSKLAEQQGRSFSWIGLPSLLAEHDFELAFEIDASAAFFAQDGRCAADVSDAPVAEPTSSAPKWAWLVGVVLAGLIAAVVLRRGRRRGTA